jgi:hypothetical protein
MRAPFWIGVLTALLAFAHLLARRVELSRLADQAASRARDEEAAAWDT